MQTKVEDSKELPEIVAIGNVDTICPNCNRELEKRPSRKTTCPLCGQFIYARMRPIDKQKVLLSESQAKEVEKQWAVINGTYDMLIKNENRFAEEKERLRQKFGCEPSDNDVKWGLLNQELLEHMARRKWGLYSNTKFHMGEILRAENKLPLAIKEYLEVCFLDLNGPNTSGVTDEELNEHYPEWIPNDGVAELAPGIIDRLKRLIKKIDMEQREVERIYFEGASSLHQRLRLPLSPEAAWKKISAALKNNE